MGLPTIADNFGGYEHARLLNKAENIKSNSYYLIHGTLDDNVHYQQSLMLAKVLEQKDILFRQQVKRPKQISSPNSKPQTKNHPKPNFHDSHTF